MGDAESPCDVDHARLAGGGDELGDDFDIILRDLLGMLLAGPAGMARGQGRATFAKGSGFGRHDRNQTRKSAVDNWKIDL